MMNAFTFCIFRASGTPMTQLICTSSWASKMFSQLGGVDVVPAGDDHALDALLEVDEAVLVHVPQVAGMDPGQAVLMGLEGLGRLLRVVEIALHHRGSGQTDLPLLAVGQLLLGCRA